MYLFYAPHLTLDDTLILLDEEESRHGLKVLRLAIGEEMVLTNGQGIKAVGRFFGQQGRQAQVEIETAETTAFPACSLCMAVGPTKNHDRYEWFVEKATELGLQQLVPVISVHSERKNIHVSRLQRLMVAALKQSQSYYLPELTEETSFSDFVKQPFEGQKFIAWCGETPKEHMIRLLQKNSPAWILIGPEGDFSEQEVTLAIQHGYVPISLGKKRLRTETAALVACHIFNLINET